ncbi:hypothetical protein ACHWQZ_G010291 [Mnemiopsis leidyi]
MAGISSYDCYNQKCCGTGAYYDTYISCDQALNSCSTNYNGYPECDYNGYGGSGVYCNGFNYYCSYYAVDGEAYCSYYGDDNYFFIYPIIGCSIFVFIIAGCCVICCRRRRRRAAQQTVIIRQTTTPQVRTPVVQNINVIAPPRNYGAVPVQQAGYQGQQSGYPGQQSGYPAQQSGYPGPGHQYGYPAQQSGYLAQQSGYPAQQSGYSGQQSGYPTQQSGYPGQQGGYPAQQSGYTGQQSGYHQEGKFADRPPPYDANAPPAPTPPTNEYATNPNFKAL